MKKSTLIILITLLVVLIGVNVFLLVKNTSSCCSSSCCSVNKGKSEQKGRHEHFMSEKLNLTTAQKQQYDSLRAFNRVEAKCVFHTMQHNQEILANYLISRGNNDKIIDSLETLIAQNQKQLLMCHVKQYQELTSILQPQQQKTLDSIFKDICVWGKRCKVK